MIRQWTPTQHGSEERGLRRKVARGLKWTILDTWGTQLLGLVIYAILANLLEPIDFGLVTFAMVFVALGQLLADQGLGDAVIQRPTLTRTQLNTAFWAALATGLLLATVGFLSADLIAAALGDSRLAPILRVLSAVFAMVGLSSIQMGLLRRELDFRSLAVRKLSAVAVGGVVGVWMAFSGFGAWALVGQQIAAAAVTVVALWAASPFRPGLSFSVADFRSMFGFGAKVVGSDLVHFISRNSDNLLIGVFLGLVPLGFYGVAYRILDTSQQLLIAGARRLLFPTFARLQHDRDRTRKAYLRVLRATAALTLPGYIGLALVAQEAIVVIFGQKWEASAPVAVMLFLIGPVLTLQASSGAVWNAMGHPEVTLRFRILTMIVDVVGFFIAVLVFGTIFAVAVSYVVRGYLLLPLNLYWVRAYAGVPIRDQLLSQVGVGLASLVMALVVLGAKLLLEDSVSRAVLLAVEVALGIVAFAIALSFTDRPLVRELASVAMQVVPGGERLGRRLGVRTLGGPRRRSPIEPSDPMVDPEEDTVL